jgi:phosphate transport system substrate-binding protein
MFLPLGISAGVQIYDENIPTVEDDGYGITYLYNPTNEYNELATLDGEASYKFGAEPITLDGATALYPVYAAFANETFPSSALEREKFLFCSTTTGAYERLIKGEVDMIFVASASKAQAEAAKAMGVELNFTPIGREAFVFFVNSRNPLENITVEEIQGIYSGKITEWSQLGVKGLGNIRPFQRDEGSGSQTALQGLMGDIPLIEPIIDDRVDGMGGIIERTADYKNYKNAIGYSFRFYSTEMVGNDQIKLLSINGVAPTRENIINGTYPIAGDFYAVTTQNSDPRCAEFIEWILSDEGQELIEKTGYVGVSGETQ